MYKKNINLLESRQLSEAFCKDFDLDYCQIYYVDVIGADKKEPYYGVYSYLYPSTILILDTYKNKNKLGILMHELTHHLEREYYSEELDYDADAAHGYHYQLAKRRVIKWCENNISDKADWSIPLGANVKDTVTFKL